MNHRHLLCLGVRSILLIVQVNDKSIVLIETESEVLVVGDDIWARILNLYFFAPQHSCIGICSQQCHRGDQATKRMRPVWVTLQKNDLYANSAFTRSGITQTT
ncbi:hypothetical protein D3C72_1921760 [compost metagenome]